MSEVVVHRADCGKQAKGGMHRENSSYYAKGELGRRLAFQRYKLDSVVARASACRVETHLDALTG
jgi:hypothetical protein